MAPRGYTTSEDVAAYMGRTFTYVQAQVCDGLIEAAEQFIDAETGRRWMVSITDEVYHRPGQDVFLRSTPVVSVQAVKLWESQALTTLVSLTDYEVRDLKTGWLHLLRGLIYDVVRFSPDEVVRADEVWVSYTPQATVDRVIELAAKKLAAAWMPATDASGVSASSGIKSYSVGGGDLSVTYQDAASLAAAAQGVPDDVAALLRTKKRFVFA